MGEGPCNDGQNAAGRPHAGEIRVTAGHSPLSCSLPFLAAAALPIAAASRPGPVPELRRGGCSGGRRPGSALGSRGGGPWGWLRWLRRHDPRPAPASRVSLRPPAGEPLPKSSVCDAPAIGRRLVQDSLTDSPTPLSIGPREPSRATIGPRVRDATENVRPLTGA